MHFVGRKFIEEWLDDPGFEEAPRNRYQQQFCDAFNAFRGEFARTRVSYQTLLPLNKPFGNWLLKEAPDNDDERADLDDMLDGTSKLPFLSLSFNFFVI